MPGKDGQQLYNHISLGGFTNKYNLQLERSVPCSCRMLLPAPQNTSLRHSLHFSSVTSKHHAKVGGFVSFPHSRPQRHHARRGGKFKSIIPSTPISWARQAITQFWCRTAMRFALLHVMLRFQALSHSLYKRLCPSVRMSARISAAPSGRMYVKFDIGEFFMKVCWGIPSLVKIRPCSLCLYTSESDIYMKRVCHCCVILRDLCFQFRWGSYTTEVNHF
jgi:hypothetical protein